MADKSFNVLSIDGGGVRGVFAAKMLSLIETKLDVDIHETFDLIVGTSTGSIIAGAMAIKYDLTKLVDDYQKNASNIFQKRLSAKGLLRSKYNSEPLSNFLQEQLGDIKLGEISKPLILNATNVSIGDVYVFKSAYQRERRKGDYVRDGEVPLYKAILASCAAPTYFDPVDIDGTLVCDGGIWANNPSLVGYTDAIRNFDVKNIKILSVGTGQRQEIYRHSKRWGLFNGWGGSKLVDFMMSCQTNFPQNVLQLVNKDNIFRINPQIDGYELDNYHNIPTLMELAKSQFPGINTKIADFLNLGSRRQTNET